MLAQRCVPLAIVCRQSVLYSCTNATQSHRIDVYHTLNDVITLYQHWLNIEWMLTQRSEQNGMFRFYRIIVYHTLNVTSLLFPFCTHAPCCYFIWTECNKDLIWFDLFSKNRPQRTRPLGFKVQLSMKVFLRWLAIPKRLRSFFFCFGSKCVKL